MLNIKDFQAINKVIKQKVEVNVKAEGKVLRKPKKSTIERTMKVLKDNTDARRVTIMNETGLSNHCVDRTIGYLLSIKEITRKLIGTSGPYDVYVYNLAETENLH